MRIVTACQLHRQWSIQAARAAQLQSGPLLNACCIPLAQCLLRPALTMSFANMRIPLATSMKASFWGVVTITAAEKATDWHSVSWMSPVPAEMDGNRAAVSHCTGLRLFAFLLETQSTIRSTEGATPAAGIRNFKQHPARGPLCLPQHRQHPPGGKSTMR